MKRISFEDILAASLVFVLAACGGAPMDDAAVGEAESSLTTTSYYPPGECTTTQTLNRVTSSAGADVIRGTCAMVCKRSAYQMGIWSNYIVKPDGAASEMKSNYGTTASNVARSTSVDVPYVAGTYRNACTTVFREKSNSTQDFPTTPYPSATF